MNNQTLLVVLAVIIVAAGVAFAMGRQHQAESEPQGVIGNAAAALSDKISQGSEQMKADAHGESADQHMDNVKDGLGIK